MQSHLGRTLTVITLAALAAGAVALTSSWVLSRSFSSAEGTATAVAEKVPLKPPSAEAGTHQEVATIGLTPETRCQELTSFCLDGDGNLLLCDSVKQEIKVVSQADQLLARWPMDFAPYLIRSRDDGTFYVGGRGRLALLDATGKVIKEVRSTGKNFPMKRPAGIAWTDKDLFVSFASGGKLGTRGIIVRFDHDFGRPKVIATGLLGTCDKLDIDARDGKVYLAENGRHRVSVYDREGTLVGKWGKYDRTKLEGFSGCCNPRSIGFGPQGSLYTTESRSPDRIKRYSVEGKFLGLVAYVGLRKIKGLGRPAGSSSCTKVYIGKKAERLFVLDEDNDVIRVLARRAESKS